MIALKFFANMFAHPACENVAAQNAAKILDSLTPLAGTKDQRIKLPVANVVLKYTLRPLHSTATRLVLRLITTFAPLLLRRGSFSSILCDDTTMTSGKRCALALIKQVPASRTTFFSDARAIVC